jgi:hypothetical protein
MVSYRYLSDGLLKARVAQQAGISVEGVYEAAPGVLVVQVPEALADKGALDAYLATRGYFPSPNDDLALRDPRYEVQTVVAGKVTRTDWYQVDNGDGTFSELAKAEVNTWSASRLISVTTTLYYTDGSAGPSWTDTMWTAGTIRIRRRS